MKKSDESILYTRGGVRVGRLKARLKKGSADNPIILSQL